ncbi:MAG TPA: RNA-processing protein [Candidatus Woesearchaeota archaeon]|nr:RNA-processing protein [Candidatus Woesearchaeota archaeon]
MLVSVKFKKALLSLSFMASKEKPPSGTKSAPAEKPFDKDSEDSEDYSYSDEVRIPKERVAVLIGKKGSEKKELEQAGNSRLQVDSKEGFVRISSKDPVRVMQMHDVVLAVGRGFNPQIARLLFKTDYVLEVLDIEAYSRSKNKSIRLKGRVIGEEGKARRIIEELTETYISVFGKTISIIGQAYNVSICRRAVESLLSGSPHSSVYFWLEKKRKELKYQDFLGQDILK